MEPVRTEQEVSMALFRRHRPAAAAPAARAASQSIEPHDGGEDVDRASEAGLVVRSPEGYLATAVHGDESEFEEYLRTL